MEGVQGGLSQTLKCTRIAWDLVKGQILTLGLGIRFRVSDQFPGEA